MDEAPFWLEPCAASPLFRGIPAEQVLSLAKGRVREQTLARGEVLRGYLRNLGIVTKGRLAVRSTGGTLLNQLCPGDMFGVSTVFTDYSVHITEISAAVASGVALIGEEELTQIFAEDFSVNRNYLAFLTDRIRFLNWKIDLFSASSAEQKLRLYLLHQRKEDGPVTVDPLARLGKILDMGRASLYRVIEKLEADGVIRRESRCCWWVDWERLEQSSENCVRKSLQPGKEEF